MRDGRSLSRVFAAFLSLATFVAGAADWERPRTTRRCLQPPLAERMFTLFNDAKICFAEVVHERDWSVNQNTAELANACWFFKDGRPFDFRAAQNRLPADGVPLHGLEWSEGGVRVTLAVCCDYVRAPTAHGRFAVSNAGMSDYEGRYSFRLRHGPEWRLLGGIGKRMYSPDFYRSYASIPESWDGLANDWSVAGREIRSASGGCMTLSKLPSGAQWDATRGELSFPVRLAPGGKFSFDFTLGFGEPVEPDVNAVSAATARRWRQELAKLNRLPKTVTDDPGRVRIVKNLVVQMLQCFACPKGKDYVLPRQGGQHRGVWPWDNQEALAALGEIGDFGGYVRAALDFYFNVCDGSSYGVKGGGRLGPFFIDWDQNTANVLGMFGRYAERANDRAFWARHRDRALAAFRWVMDNRAKPGDPDELVAGLALPGRSSDYKSKGQSWGFTDAGNIRSLAHFVKAAERFDDPAKGEVRAGYDGYVAALKGAMEPYRRQARESGVFKLPARIGGDEASCSNNTGYACMACVGLDNGFLDAKDVMGLWTAWTAYGRTSDRGLTYRWFQENPHLWYTTARDGLWHHALARIGRRDLADRILEGNLRYAMTEECCVGERYRDDDPWFLPWSPNVSGSGRLILMMIDSL